MPFSQNISKLIQQFKRFKTPFFYFGIISVISIGLIFLTSDSSRTKFIQSNEGAFFDSFFDSLTGSKEGNLFLGIKDILPLEPPDSNIIGENSLAGFSPTWVPSLKVFGSIFGQEDIPEDRKDIFEYVVEPGDNLWSIAGKFDISLDTLCWANDLSKTSIIKSGKKLVILPVDGIIHHVKSGDTVGEIAKTYKGEVERIVAFNELSDEGDIYISDILVIPDGAMPKKAPTFTQVPLASSYFIFPTQGKITQGLHWYNAIDIANKCGTPIYAAASGTVLKVRITSSRSRWGIGNYIKILHDNEIVTYYGHISTSFVAQGETVYRGQKIALIGGQPGTPGAGRSTGCHLHFGVSGAKNPLRNYSVGSYIGYR